VTLTGEVGDSRVLQVENRTPFVPAMFVFPDAEGVDTLYVVVKATFTIARGAPRVAEEQRPIVPADAYRGEPGKSSLEHAGQAHLPRPRRMSSSLARPTRPEADRRRSSASPSPSGG
jgi:hypothetical protein